jgi:hypothetical protein
MLLKKCITNEKQTTPMIPTKTSCYTDKKSSFHDYYTYYGSLPFICPER